MGHTVFNGKPSTQHRSPCWGTSWADLKVCEAGGLGVDTVKVRRRQDVVSDVLGRLLSPKPDGGRFRFACPTLRS
jgi:hypothetical protein